MTTQGHSDESKPSLSTLKGSMSYLPDATYQDFLDLKKIWEPRLPPSDETESG